jgi:hypothetical protein
MHPYRAWLAVSLLAAAAADAARAQQWGPHDWNQRSFQLSIQQSPTPLPVTGAGWVPFFASGLTTQQVAPNLSMPGPVVPPVPGPVTLQPGIHYRVSLGCGAGSSRAIAGSHGYSWSQQITLRLTSSTGSPWTPTVLTPGQFVLFHNPNPAPLSVGTNLPWIGLAEASDTYQTLHQGSLQTAGGRSVSAYAVLTNGVGPTASTHDFVLDVSMTCRVWRSDVPWTSFAWSNAGPSCAFVLTVPQPVDLQLLFGFDSSSHAGGTQAFPDVPCARPGVSFAFCHAPTGNWFDPPLALGYDFQQTGGSLFTDILTLPVGIDGDGLFEVQVGNQSLGQFAAGTGVDFVQLLGSGVPAFRIAGIDPAVDATDVEAFPVQLAFDTLTADFTMTPVTWRAIGTSCSDAICAQCPSTSLAPIGDALEGNLNFGVAVGNGPGNGLAACFVGIGSAAPTPLPLFCGLVHLPLQTAAFDVGITALPGTGTCDGAGSIPVPLVPTPSLFGSFLTLQALTLCPQGGFGLTHAIEFPIGS